MSTKPPTVRARPRRTYIDWARAVAVLVMMEAHVFDAWTRAADKKTTAYGFAMLLGGFAAPMFLWLAGVSLVLSAAEVARRQGNRAEAVGAICRRGLEIFVLAFLFRLQAFALTPGSYPVTLFRVDILNIMGPAIAAAGVVWGLAPSARVLTALYAAAAVAISMVTPVVRGSALVGRLPIWVQWYLSPAGDNTTFTVFPWVGFVFAGAAVGALIAEVREPTGERRLQVSLAVVGAALVATGLCAASLPSLYRQSSFWTTSPTYFAIRVGVLMLILSATCAFARLAERGGTEFRRLERLGRNSLFVYWIHVELAYGYASWLWRGRLPLWGAAMAYVAFCTAMYGAIVLRDWVRDRWRTRRVGPATQPLAGQAAGGI